MKVLSLNAGSNSLKFVIVEIDPGGELFGRIVVSGAYDNIGKEGGVFTLFEGLRAVHSEAKEISDYGHAAELLLGGSIGAARGNRASVRWVKLTGSDTESCTGGIFFMSRCESTMV